MKNEGPETFVVGIGFKIDYARLAFVGDLDRALQSVFCFALSFQIDHGDDE